MARQAPDSDSLTPSSARALVLRWLGQRELTAAQVRLRLRRRQFPDPLIDDTLKQLSSDGLLDDRRAARARARHDVVIKRQGRSRVLRQVQAIGVDRDTARDAVAAVFEEVDEERLLAEALSRRLRGQPLPTERQALRRLYGWLLRQGFDPAPISALFRRGGREVDE